jgi:acyl-coenzyme A thioesterase PaaI-like protein
MIACFLNKCPSLHGRLCASVIDTAAHWSAYCHLPQENGFLSIDMKVCFLAPVLDGESLSKGRESNLEKPYISAKRKYLKEMGEHWLTEHQD